MTCSRRWGCSRDGRRRIPLGDTGGEAVDATRYSVSTDAAGAMRLTSDERDDLLIRVVTASAACPKLGHWRNPPKV